MKKRKNGIPNDAITKGICEVYLKQHGRENCSAFELATIDSFVKQKEINYGNNG